MKISTRGRYALLMMLDLAEHTGEGSIALRDIAERQGVSKKYLEQIVPSLHKAELINTSRGHQGGYYLASSPDKVTIGAVLRAAEGSLSPVSCLESELNECPNRSSCETLPIWEGLYKVINDYLDGITLQSVIDSKAAAGASGFGI